MKKMIVWKDCDKNEENTFDGQWEYHSESAVRTDLKWQN